MPWRERDDGMQHKPTFLHQNKPLITCMVQSPTPEEAISAVRNAAGDGADAFGLQICRLQSEYRTEEHLKRIFRPMGNRPIYVTNYRYGYNEGKSDEELAEGLLFALRCGANLIDVMGDLYCKDPRELTCDPAAVEKQKRLIDEIHERGGEVLISSHLFRYAPAEEVLEIALAQQERGADVVKIVCAADSEEQELEALRIITLLRQALRVPFLFLVGGSHCRLVRHIGPMLGCCMWLTVPAHDALSTKVQPVCRAIRAIADNFDYAPDRTFDDE